MQWDHDHFRYQVKETRGIWVRNICAEAEPPVRIQQGADRAGRAGRKTRMRENCEFVERTSKTVPSDSCSFISVTV